MFLVLHWFEEPQLTDLRVHALLPCACATAAQGVHGQPSGEGLHLSQLLNTRKAALHQGLPKVPRNPPTAKSTWLPQALTRSGVVAFAS